MRAMLLLLLLAAGCASSTEEDSSETPEPVAAARAPHVVFVTGDCEYRSEESTPLLAEILDEHHGVRTTVLYCVDPESGEIDPMQKENLPGLEALADADLAVFFLRFRRLPPAQLQAITQYVDSGRPVAGFRTSTHAFAYPDGPHRSMNDAWSRELFGQKWITHHGHFADGQEPLTEVTLAEERADHPVLRGVRTFQAYSWLYHVEGGGDTLAGDSEPLLWGRALRSGHEDAGRLERFPLRNPVAWTKSHAAPEGTRARVFFTTLGHPYDFRAESMRRLAVQGILWALGREETIPRQGVDVSFVSDYQPNNSGNHGHKKGLRP